VFSHLTGGSQSDRLHPDKIAVANQLLTPKASSDGVEIIFHNLVWCNQNFATSWGTGKAGILVFLLKLNRKPMMMTNESTVVTF
jgi:hypothetical protein